VLPLALSSGHEIGLAVVAACFIAFALASSLLFPRFRVQFPGRGLPAFIVVTFVFFFGMPKETKKSERAAQTFSQAQPTTAGTTTKASPPATLVQSTTTTPETTTRAKPAPKPQTIQVTETEFKITLGTKALKAGSVTFDVKNVGKIPHDLAIVGGLKTPLISPGKTAMLSTTLKAGKIELYCTVPGHKQAGMDLKVTAS